MIFDMLIRLGVFTLAFLFILEGALCPDDTQAMMKMADALWAQRDDIDKLKACILQYQNIIRVEPNNNDACQKLSHAFFFLGSYSLTDRDEKRKAFKMGIAAGENAVNLDPDDVESNFWYAINKGSLGEMDGAIKSAFMLPGILKNLEVVEKSDASYCWGGCYRFWGRAFYRAPGFILGILSKTLPDRFKKRKSGDFGKEDQIAFFQDSLKHGPNLFETHVFLAESYIQLGKQDQAKKELEWVVATPAEIMPEAAPENRHWQNKARVLLAGMDKGD
jgi:tetratricopeptide (TPR) repeat protein